MRPNTAELLTDIKGESDTRAKLNLLKDAYWGETAYIVASGPSLNDYRKEALIDFLSEKLVLVVKRAYNHIGASSDIHLLNLSSLCPYHYSDSPPIRILHGDYDGYDITLPMFPAINRDNFFQNNLAVHHQFDLWLLMTRCIAYPGVV